MDMPMGIGGGGGLAASDAEFLDGMLALGQQVAGLCEKYISDSTAASSPQVVDMARGMLESIGYQSQMLGEVRGYADGDALRNQEHLEGVEVTATY